MSPRSKLWRSVLLAGFVLLLAGGLLFRRLFPSPGRRPPPSPTSPSDLSVLRQLAAPVGTGATGTRSFAPVSRQLATINVPVGGLSFPRIMDVTFSPDGTQVAYRTEIDADHWSMCVNGQCSRPYRSPVAGAVSYGRPVFSDDGKSMAYVANDDFDYAVVRDGREVRRFPLPPTTPSDLRRFALPPKDLTLVPGSREVAFVHTSDTDSTLFIGDAVVPLPFRFQHGLRFLPRGEGITYVATSLVSPRQVDASCGASVSLPCPFAQRDRSRDEVFNEAADTCGDFPSRECLQQFCGTHVLLCAARLQVGWPDEQAFSGFPEASFVAVIDREGALLGRGRLFPASALTAYDMSPDGGHLLYAVTDRSFQQQILREDASGGLEQIATVGRLKSPIFTSLDGAHTAFFASPLGAAGDTALFVDGQVRPEGEPTCQPVLSGSGRLAFCGRPAGRGHAIVLNGRSFYTSMPGHEVAAPFFGPNGRLGYVEHDPVKGESWLVVDARAVGRHVHEVWSPRFSTDGRTVGYGALEGAGLWWRVLDVSPHP